MLCFVPSAENFGVYAVYPKNGTLKAIDQHCAGFLANYSNLCSILSARPEVHATRLGGGRLLETGAWRLLGRNDLFRYGVGWVDRIQDMRFDEGIRILAGLGNVRRSHNRIAQHGRFDRHRIAEGLQ